MLKKESYSYRFLLFCKKGLVFLGLFAFVFLFQIIPLTLLNVLNIDYGNWSDMTQTLFTLGCDLSVLGGVIFIYRKRLIRDFRNFFNKNFLSNLEFAFKTWFLGFVVMCVSNLIIIGLLDNSIAGNEQAVRDLIEQAPIYMLFSVAIFAPITEEIVFRKGIKDVISNRYVYILASGLFFGYMHILGNITTPLDYLYLIPYASLGISFAYMYQKTDNIFYSIFMHSVHNTMAFLLLVMAGSVL